MNPLSAADTYHVQLFGGPRLFRGPEEIFLSPRQAALVGLLFGRDDPALGRSQAVSLLWPNEEPEKARHCLSQLLYTLKARTGKPGLFEARKEELRRLSPETACDLEDFKGALQKPEFQTCSALLKKGFASKQSGLASRQHANWIEGREAELRQAFRKRAERQWRACSKEELWEEACMSAEALLDLAPDAEDRLQLLMEAKVKAGCPVEAKEAYEEFASRRKEKSWTPQEQTNALLDVVQAALGSADGGVVHGVGKGLPEPPLLGRNGERSLLRKTLRTTPKRELRGIMISGEAGIGKTRLVQESLQGLLIDGPRVFSAQSAELEQLIPLNPLIEAFAGPTVGHVLRQLEEPWRTVLFGVMPGHYLGDGPIPEAPHIQPGSVPRRLFEAFYQLLLSLVQDGPVILVLEDLQWADDTTLSVLDFLVRRWDHGELQMLISARAEEIRKNPALVRFLENFRIHVAFREIPLYELEPQDSEALIRHLAPKPLCAESITQLRSLAGGNPYFLIELTLEFLADRLGSMATPQEIVPIPVSIRQVLDRRLSQLSADAELVLGSLAVLSRPIETNDLARITQLSGPNCLTGLDQLDRFRLVMSRGARVVVSHELVRHTFYQSLTDSRRAWLHNQAARHILRTRKPVPPDELALHFHRAGETDDARLYATEAGNRAEASGAVPEALRFLQIAREHSTEPAAVADLIGRMGHLNYKHQNLEEAAPLLELAAQRFRRQGHQAKALRAEVERIDCLAQRGNLPVTECLEELRRLKDEAEGAHEWGAYTKALDVEVHRLDHAGHQEAVGHVLDEAKECSEKGGAEARCRARSVLALNVYYGSPREGLAAAREAVTIALSTDDTDLQLHALNRLIVVLLYQGRLHTEEGRNAFDLAAARLARSGDLILKFFIRLNRAVWHLEIGELHRAKSAFAQVEPVIRGTDAKDAHTIFHLNEGELGLASFDTPTAHASYTRAEASLRPASPKAFRAIINAGLGLCALRDGNLGEARSRENEQPPLPGYWTFDPSVVVSFKAGMLRRRGDHSAADQLLFDVAQDVKERLVTAWIKLSLERARVLRRKDPEVAKGILMEVLVSTEKLGLEERTRNVVSLLED